MMREANNKKIWLFSILALALLLRLYKINSPILDLYPVRQEQCAMVARNFFRESLNIFNGKVDWFGNLNSSWYLELPLVSYLAAILYKIFGIHEFLGRLVAVFFSTCSLGIFYLLVRDFFDETTALLSLLVFTISPLNIYFGRVFMPEPLMLFFSLALIWAFNRWIKSNRKIYFFVALISGIFAFLNKLTSVSLLAVAAYLSYLEWDKKALKKFSLWLFFILSLIPAILWYARTDALMPVVLESPAGVLSTFLDPHFYIRMFDSFGIFIFTPLGISPFIVGFLKRPDNRRQSVFYFWSIVLLFYLLIAPKVNFVHYYYQIPFIPVASLFIGRGLAAILEKKFWQNTILNRINSRLIVGFVIFVMFVASWFSIQPFYKYNHSVYRLGMFMRRNTPRGSLIIAGRCREEAPLYYCDRKGWEINEYGDLSYRWFHPEEPSYFLGELDLVKYLIKQGADYYLACNLNAFSKNAVLVKYLKDNYKVFLSSDSYIVFDLKD